MSGAMLCGEPPVEITLRRSARARRLSLRVSALDGRVTLTLPARAAVADAMRFAADRRGWIDRARARVGPETRIVAGGTVPVDGAAVRIVVGGRASLAGGVLRLPRGRPGAAARGVLRDLARRRMAELSDGHAATLGVGFARLAIGDPRSRWGSCSSEGRLMYSFRLIMAPVAVQDYVAAHEVAHLRHLDHSPAFWAVVEGLCPDWRRHRAWLREHGATLHRVRFDDDVCAPPG